MTEPGREVGRTDSGKGRLILVATPIGNLEDLSPRAERILRETPVIMAEDTRRTGRLLKDGAGLYSYHDHNVSGRLPQIREFLMNGTDVAVVSDAGTPGISDPAFKAVRVALDSQCRVEVIPGPSAVITALVASGLPVDRFAFEGFLPRKKGARRRRLEAMSDYSGSLVYFIGPHHLQGYLSEILDVMGDRRACIAREMTKLHEEYARGSISEMIKEFDGRRARGEITLVVEGASPRDPSVD